MVLEDLLAAKMYGIGTLGLHKLVLEAVAMYL
jgi:hypothetical protein